MARCVALAAIAVACLFVGGFVRAAEPQEGTFYRIRNVNSKKALALDDKAADGAQIVQRSIGENERQQWNFVKAGKYYRIVNRKTGQALNVHSTEENTPVVANDNGKNQQWSLEKQGEAFVIRSRHSGLVIDVAEESKDRKAPVVQFSFHQGRNQIFEIEPVEK